ncbi:MAG: ferrous iron transport protein A [Cyanobacteria bacterium P01_A01_bin.135]
MLKKLLRSDSWVGVLRRSAPPQDDWGFTYLGRSVEREALPTIPCDLDDVAVPASSAFPLHLAQPGDRLQVSTLKGDRATVRQLQKLGVCCGADVVIVSKQASGSVVIRVGAAQLGLSATMTPWVMVSAVA